MNITRGRIGGAKKIVIYGPEGIGKSTFASQFPDPVFIDTEGSTKDMDVARFDKATSWMMILQQVQYVINHPGCCRSLVIDTADWAEQIEVASLCDEKGWSGLEDLGYGKGYTYSAEKFGKFLNLLEDVIGKGVNVVITAHAQLRKVELPEEMGAYDHWEMKTSKKVAPMIREWADAVFFANFKTRVIEVDRKKKAQGGQRVMYTNHTPFWDAKNRYGLPDEVPFEYESIRHIIEPGDAKHQTQETPYIHVEPPVRTEPAAPPKESTPPPVTGEQMNLPLNNETPKTAVPDDNAEVVTDNTLDRRIPKALRDLMLSSVVSEWSLQAVVQARLPGAFPDDMEVRDYPQDFIDEWIMPNWEKIVGCVKEMREKMEIPFD